jgi:hypothetical protein
MQSVFLNWLLLLKPAHIFVPLDGLVALIERFIQFLCTPAIAEKFSCIMDQEIRKCPPVLGAEELASHCDELVSLEISAYDWPYLSELLFPIGLSSGMFRKLL